MQIALPVTGHGGWRGGSAHRGVVAGTTEVQSEP